MFPVCAESRPYISLTYTHYITTVTQNTLFPCTSKHGFTLAGAGKAKYGGGSQRGSQRGPPLSMKWPGGVRTSDPYSPPKTYVECCNIQENSHNRGLFIADISTEKGPLFAREYRNTHTHTFNPGCTHIYQLSYNL